MAPGRYRHYKGGEYEVLGLARHSETLEPMVLYRPLYNQTGLWVRPYAMFVEFVNDANGQMQSRFAYIAECTAKPRATGQKRSPAPLRLGTKNDAGAL
jgi:hypothetical protein